MPPRNGSSLCENPRWALWREASERLPLVQGHAKCRRAITRAAHCPSGRLEAQTCSAPSFSESASCVRVKCDRYPTMSMSWRGAREPGREAATRGEVSGEARWPQHRTRACTRGSARAARRRACAHLRVRIKQLSECAAVGLRDRCERVGERAAERRVWLEAAGLDLLDVGAHLVDGVEQLAQAPVVGVHLRAQRHQLLRPVTARHRRAHDVVDADPLRLRFGNAQPHALKCARHVLAAERELGAHVGLRLDACARQRHVDEQQDGRRAFARLVLKELVVELVVVRELRAGRVPADHHLLRVNLPVEAVHGRVEVRVDGRLLRLGVRHRERVDDVDDAVGHRAEQRADHAALLVLPAGEVVGNRKEHGRPQLARG